MQAGRLRHLIVISPPGAAGKDGDGFISTTPGAPISVWAAQEVVSGAEVHELGRDVGTQMVKFTVRYRTGVTSHCRITACGSDYNVLSVTDPGGMHQWLEITAEAVN